MSRNCGGGGGGGGGGELWSKVRVISRLFCAKATYVQ